MRPSAWQRLSPFPDILLNFFVLGLASFESHSTLPCWPLAHSLSRCVMMDGSVYRLRISCSPSSPWVLAVSKRGAPVTPMVANGETEPAELDNPRQASLAPPLGRIKNTRKLLVVAAVLMGVSADFVQLRHDSVDSTGSLRTGRTGQWPRDRLSRSQVAGQRLRDKSCYYVFSMIHKLPLRLRARRQLTGLINLIPRYLPRFGMAPRWASYRRPMVIVLFAINLLVTHIFHASVEAQGGADATGVSVILSGRRRRSLSAYGLINKRI